MDTREKLENLALRRALLPATLYIVGCTLLYLAIDNAGNGAHVLFGEDKAQVFHILEIGFIALITIFFIFYLVYQSKLAEASGKYSLMGIIRNSPYPMLVISLKKYALAAISTEALEMLNYQLSESVTLTLQDLLTENSYRSLKAEIKQKADLSKDYSDLIFKNKQKQSLSLVVNVYKLTLPDDDYFIFSFRKDTSIRGPVLSETADDIKKAPQKRSFQF